MNKTPFFLAIGDIVIDAFIDLDPRFTRTQVTRNKTELVMPFGMKVVYDGVKVLPAVGNGPNTSVSAKRLGLDSASLTHIGNDDFGDDCIKELERNGVSTEYITRQEGIQTNYHYVLSLGAERTILIKHAPFSYDLEKELVSNKTGEVLKPDWVYFTSVADAPDTPAYHQQIAKWIKDNNIKMTFQPGGPYQMVVKTEQLKDIYAVTELFVCNVEEAEQILGLDITQFPHTRNTPEFTAHVVEMMKQVASLGPKLVAISDGPDGTFAFDGEKSYYLPIYPDPKPPVERTGAGDSFASTFSSYLAQGYSFTDSLLRAPINSMSVVQYVGAQEGLLTKEKLEEYLAQAPADYKVKEIN
jgi:sugar/nucleoside kinase (ribokinase family)